MYKTRGSIDRRVGKNDRARRGGSITTGAKRDRGGASLAFSTPGRGAARDLSAIAIVAWCALRATNFDAGLSALSVGEWNLSGVRASSSVAARVVDESFIHHHHQSSIIARRRVPSRSIAHLFPPSDDARACFVSLVVASFVRSRSVIASKLAASVVGVRARASSASSASASRDVVVGSGVTATGERASSASRAGEGADMASTCAANDELAI